jgi:hypothetical protein
MKFGIPFVRVGRDRNHVTVLLSTDKAGHVLTLGMPEASDLAAALANATKEASQNYGPAAPLSPTRGQERF